MPGFDYRAATREVNEARGRFSNQLNEIPDDLMTSLQGQLTAGKAATFLLLKRDELRNIQGLDPAWTQPVLDDLSAWISCIESIEQEGIIPDSDPWRTICP